MRKVALGATLFVVLVAAGGASAQGTVRGAQKGAETGGRAAGPAVPWWAAPWKRLQAQLMGFLEFNSLTPSCSRYEPIHSFWRYTYGTDKSHGKTVRA
jgi:hypothetical protein